MLEGGQRDGCAGPRFDGAEPVVQRQAGERATRREVTPGQPRGGLVGELLQRVGDGRRIGEQSRRGFHLAAARGEHREKLRAPRPNAVLARSAGKEPPRVRERRRSRAEPHQPGHEMRVCADTGSRLRVELDRRILRARAVGEAARAQHFLQLRAALLERHPLRRARRRLCRHRSDHREQPLPAAHGQLGLAALM